MLAKSIKAYGGEFDMEEKYRTWHKIQGISCICYAITMISLYLMIYAESSNTPIIIMAVIATVSLITTITSGLIKAFFGYKMGLKTTKKDWLLIGIALILAIIYLANKHL